MHPYKPKEEEEDNFYNTSKSEKASIEDPTPKQIVIVNAIKSSKFIVLHVFAIYLIFCLHPIGPLIAAVIGLVLLFGFKGKAVKVDHILGIVYILCGVIYTIAVGITAIVLLAKLQPV